MIASKFTIFDAGLKNRLTLYIYEDGEVKWESTIKNIKLWPKEFKKRYGEVIIISGKKTKDSRKRLKNFFFARGIMEDRRLFQELFLGIKLNIGEEEKKYIKETLELASSYYNEKYDFKKFFGEEFEFTA